MTVQRRELRLVSAPTGRHKGVDATGPEEWTDRARCVEVEPELFFPGKGEGSDGAKTVCGSCEVREACLDYALRWESDRLELLYGIFGGLTPAERKRLIRQQREQAGGAA